MRCTSPKKMSFDYEGNITFSPRKADKGIIPFTIPCGKCIACQLAYSQQWAVRCSHESLITPDYRHNLFITLTYSDKHLPGPTLVKNDFDRFLERLKHHHNYRAVYACGEYGKLTKRPHWHALIFDLKIDDLKKFGENKHGNQLFTSEELDSLWPYNDKKFPNKLGYVDFGSAAYVARYHAKGLVHGTKQEQKAQNLTPISIKTRGLGKNFLQKYWRDIFSHGDVVLDGKRYPMPRYYERWFENHHPTEYLDYVTRIKIPMLKKVHNLSDKEYEKWMNHPENWQPNQPLMVTKQQTKAEILRRKTAAIMRDRGD